MTAPLPKNEAERLAALHQCGVLDTDAEDAYDDIVQLAAHICGTPIAAVSLVGGDRQWFKSILGLDVRETPRSVAFCAHTILGTDVLVVPDAEHDPRFADNPLVTDDPHIRFYAGAPLVTDDGHALGSLCVIDRTPRQLTPDQTRALRLLAAQAANQAQLSRRLTQQERLLMQCEQAETERLRLAAIVESSSDAIWSVTLDGSLVSWNAGAERLYGYTEGEVLGRHARTLMPPEEGGLTASVSARLARGGPPEHREARGQRRDGTTADVSLTFSPIQDAVGRTIGLSCIARDITNQKRQAEVLRRSEARLAEAQRIARIGSWEYDIGAGRITWSAEMFQLFGMDAAEGEPSIEAVGTHYHPDDRITLARLREKAIRDGDPYEADVRILQPDGTTRWMHAVGRGEQDADGRVTRLFGTLMDIHERYASQERFRVLFEQSSDAHMLVGDRGIIDCNHAAVALLRCADKAQLLGLHPSCLSPEFQPDGRCSAEKGPEMEALARENASHRFEWTHRRMDGEEFPTEITLTPVTLASGPAMLAVWHDLTERKRAERQAEDYRVVLEFQKRELEKANAELAALATTDGLTGLWNHRAFQERMAEEISRSRRYATPLSLLLLDVDRFKQYNDAFGHPAGDAVLRRVADVMRDRVRETDLVARYGGEEFAVILPQTDAAGARVIAERIRAAVAAGPQPLRAVTVSVGLAALGPEAPDQTGLIARADAALYRSKGDGRDRVTSL